MIRTGVVSGASGSASIRRGARGFLSGWSENCASGVPENSFTSRIPNPSRSSGARYLRVRSEH
jgi:hypothetical protein